MPELASVIDAVTVFPDRARVTRRGRTSLEPGQHRLEISGLPMSLLADSVRAAGRGTARARLLGVRLQVKHFAETPAHTARELEEKIQSAMDADAELAAEAEGLEKAQQALDGLGAQSEVFARGLALRNRSTAEQAAVFDFLAVSPPAPYRRRRGGRGRRRRAGDRADLRRAAGPLAAAL
jgi:hypothetical protein